MIGESIGEKKYFFPKLQIKDILLIGIIVYLFKHAVKKNLHLKFKHLFYI